MKTGVTHLPLHSGRAPAWLFGRMKLLAREIVLVILQEFGPGLVLHDQHSQFMAARSTDRYLKIDLRNCLPVGSQRGAVIGRSPFDGTRNASPRQARSRTAEFRPTHRRSPTRYRDVDRPKSLIS